MSKKLRIKVGTIQEIRKGSWLRHQMIIRSCLSSLTPYINFTIQSFHMAQRDQIKDQVQGSQNLEERSLIANYNCQIFKDLLKNSRVTVVAFAAVWVVYIFECLYTWITLSTASGFATIPGPTLVKLGGNVALLVRLGQVYRLFTATLLHAGIIHIFMNSASLISFCAEVQGSVSRNLYLAVYLIGGMQGNMLSDLYNLHLGNSVTVGVGASTSICAVMGLYIAKLYIDSKKNGRVEMAKRQIITMLVYLLLISLLPSVDFFGHFGSLISGALIGLAVVPRGDPEVSQFSWLGIAGVAIYSLILFTIFV